MKETIQTGLKLKAVNPSQLARVYVDTTVQEKEIRFPTDVRFYDRARRLLTGRLQESEGRKKVFILIP